MRALRSVLTACLIAASAQPGLADVEPVQTARRAAQQLAAAADQLAEAERASDRVAALTSTVKAYEEGLDALRDGIRRAALRERDIRVRFEARRAELARLLGVLQTLERAPAQLLMIHPTGAVGTARSGMMLSEVTPSLQAEAEALRARLEEVRILQGLQNSAAEDLRAGLAGVQAARAALSMAIADRTDLPKRFVADLDQLDALVRDAETLESFADSLTGMTTAGTGGIALAAPDFGAAKGRLALPVPGSRLRGFNEADAAGIRRPGLVLSAPPLSLVTAPWPATIRYRGPLLDYGNVMILEPAAEYLIVLAGLKTVYGDVGDILREGAPLGFLGGADPAAEEFLLEASAGGGTTGRETLYIEIRHQGMPVDPAEWFTLNRE